MPSRATRDQLLRLLQTYDLSKWIFTEKVAIDSNSIPHSHPVLTLHTRHLREDDLLLATFLHEQTHWFLDARREATDKALKALRRAFPEVPVGYPEGAADLESSYLHLVINYLEFVALVQVVGEQRARQVFDFWAQDHYRAIYRMVMERVNTIRAIVYEQKLAHAVAV